MAKKMTQKMDSQDFTDSLTLGLKYPWGNAKRLWNILWALIPVLGWFALLGYFKKITVALVKGKNKELPAFGGFWANFQEGVIIFVFMIPTMAAIGIVGMVPVLGNIVALLANIFLVPWLVINFFMKGTFDALWDLKRGFNFVADNVKEYLWAYLKTLVYAVLYGLLSIVLVGIPCVFFGKFYFLAEFYKKYN